MRLRALFAVGLVLLPAPLLAAPAQLDQGTPQLLTSVVAAAASENQLFDVVAAEDLRRALEVEGERRATGCVDVGSSSCLAEVAQALGASLVLHSEVGQLGDELLFTLNLYDSSAGTSGGRRVVRASTSPALATASETATREMLADYLRLHPPAQPGARVRLLVLDAKLRGELARSHTQAEPVGDTPWLLVAGGAAGVAGASAVLVAVLLDGAARDSRVTANLETTDQKTTQRLIDQSWVTGGAAIGLYALGPTLLVGGGVLAALHLFSGGE